MTQRVCLPQNGADEFAAFWQEVGKEWLYFRYDAHEIIDAGDTIVVPVPENTT